MTSGPAAPAGSESAGSGPAGSGSGGAGSGVGAAAPVVSVSGVSKRYGATQALRGVDLDIGPGEVLGLIGANGAGKSTLIKILSGATRPTAGEIRLHGRPTGFASPLDAQDAGIQTVHQNIDDGVVFGTTVAENLTLDTLAPHRSGNSFWTSRKRTVTAARDLAAAAHLDVPLDVPVETLSASVRQHLIIARVLARRPKLLILDEPTSALSAVEADELVVTVRRLADSGVSVLYVSHRLNEIQALCDRAAVLRDGGIQRVFGAPFEGHRLVEAMLGEQVEQLQHEARAGGTAVLEAEGVRAWPSAAPFSLTARTDEVVGLTGLIGSGKTEFLEQLYGARPLVSGTLRLCGEPYRPRDPRAAVAAGVGLVPEERGVQAVLPGWSVRAHVSLPRLRAHSRGGLLSRRDESSAAERVIDAFGVRCDGPAAAIETLSGGNQQKVVVGRWLDGALRGAPGHPGPGSPQEALCPPGLAARLVLLDEPFRGVDVGARAEIARKLRDHAGEVGVIVASSDPQEVTQVADRVLVMRDGTLAGELSAGEATAERIAALMAGGAR